MLRRDPAASLLVELDLLDNDRRLRLVTWTRRDLRYGLDHLVAFGDLAEDGVLAGQPGRGSDRDEKLRPVRVRSGVRHGHKPGPVQCRSAGRELVLELVAGPTTAGSLWVTALDHEAVDHAVEGGPVVQRLYTLRPVARIGPFPQAARELDEIRHRLRRGIGQQPNPELPHRRGERGLDVRHPAPPLLE